jgi:NAD(P)-dependent dehydrogenase (short-subunit alcohol dehydrogenase family)
MTDKKQLAIISGGTSGIGLAAARCLSRDGFTPVLLGRNEVRGKQASGSIPGSFFFPCDITRSSEVNETVQEISHLGEIKTVVFSAGQYEEGLLEQVTDEDMERLFQVNTFGCIYLARAVIPYMKQGGGSMVFVSSDAALEGNIQCTIYSATKGAITSFARSLALELAVYPIRVNVVAPGDVKTPLLEKQYKIYGGSEKESAEAYPLMRIGKPEEVGEVIAFLASDKASFMTGTIVTADGGLTDW